MVAGTFRIDCVGSDSTTYNVTQLRNRTVQIEKNGSPPEGDVADNAIWAIGNTPDARESASVPNAVLSVNLPGQA